MPTDDLHFDCSWVDAFNLSAGRKGTFGYLLEWSGIGGVNLAKDIVVWNPAWGSIDSLPSDRITCVGILERLAFGADPSDPIRVTCLLSKDNQSNLRAKLGHELTSTKVKASWTLVDYDEYSKSWYQAVELLNPKRLSAALNTADGALQIEVDAVPTPISPSLDIEVYRFEFEIVPTERTQAEIQFATGPTQRVVRAWVAE
jgi:hypothetical protein